VESFHPGVSPEELIAATGFDVDVSGATPVTPPPTPEEIEALERIDPTGVSRSEFSE
jgi:hypothetical protein